MSHFDENHRFQPTRTKNSVWGLAAFSAAVFLFSVLGAKLLARMVDDGNLPRLAYERSMRGVERGQAAPQSEVYAIVRSVGVDGVTTATIPLKGPAPFSPFGDAQTAGKAAAVGAARK